ncbi:MAG: DUF1957 domain-containing protein [Candidatus Riflebacteria bacterium]|nr:DUF1957 domain-containing protein [Candidatus Riflebacteria bacterium]
MKSSKTCLALVLHAHLPFVRHPEHKDMMEERWLYEAITDTYLPLLRVFEKLRTDKVNYSVTISISPPLLNMLSDPLLISRYSDYLTKLEELAEKEVKRTEWQSDFYFTALINRKNFSELRNLFESYGRNLIAAFADLQKTGHLEIITSSATHAFLPLMSESPESVTAQIEMAVKDYKRYFKKKPIGMWLPECGYNPGDDAILKHFGITYFFTDTHGITGAIPAPKHGVYEPLKTPSGVYAFGRDSLSSRQVWSSFEGYPGDPVYREFYRDIGFDLDIEYIAPYIHESGHRLNTGIKYYKITDKNSEDKQPYNIQEALQRAETHAKHFIEQRILHGKHLQQEMEQSPIIISPYDCELFGHWWYEGPAFIYNLLKLAAARHEELYLTTPSQYLKRNKKIQKANLPISSWGHKGYSEVWLNDTNAWIYPHMHAAAERMTELAEKFHKPSPLQKRALNQAARELMLLQSSDWAFIMKTGTTVEYATKRVKDHVFRFNKLYTDLIADSIDEAWLKTVELRDNIFPKIDYRMYRQNSKGVGLRS